MEIVPLMLIAVIILLSSFPAPIKVAGRGGGGGFVGSGSGPIGIGGGYFGGGGVPGNGYRGGNVPTGGSIRDGSNVGTGYRGGGSNGKPGGGGDPGAAIVVFPKKPEEPAKPVPMPQVCKQEVRDCITAHIYGAAGAPTYHGPCCEKLKNSVPCVCKFLTSHDPKLSKAANDVLRGCHYRHPKCSKMPMPQVCRHEVRHCVDSHIYGGAGDPQHGGACCQKFKHSKKCVCTFLTSQDSHLKNNANGVVRGCRFGKPNCPKV